MRKLIRKLIAILDGTPATYGIKQKGQSTVELALVTPLLVILIAGIVEMGWFANNYLILLEVTRVGARRAATLSGDFGPQAWNDAYSLHDRYDTDFDARYDPVYTNASVPPESVPDFYWSWDEWSGSQGVEFRRREVRNCDAINTTGAYVGFYNLVLCQMLNSLDPIQIDPQKHAPEDDLGNPLPAPPESELTDDIVISVFSIQMIYNTPNTNCHVYEPNDPYVSDDITTAFNEDDDVTDSRDNTFQCARLDLSGQGGDGIAQVTPAQEFPETDAWYPVVVGRYPHSTNECNVWEFLDGAGASQRFTGNLLERDPFDYIQDGQFTFSPDINWTSRTEDPNTIAEAVALGLPSQYPYELYIGDPPIVQSAGMDENEPDIDPGNNGNTSLSGTPNVDILWPEAQRGFVYTGYHKIEREYSGTVISDAGATINVDASLVCYGSEFNIYDVEELMRGNDLFLTPTEFANAQATNPAFGVVADPNPPHNGASRNIDQRQFLRPQGLVLVEIHWQHSLLLDLPAFSPVFNALGGNQTTISVWSAFPIPTAVPELQYDLLWDNFYTDTN